MKKLLFVISQLYKGGAETSLVNLLNHLDYAEYDVELLVLNQEPVENAVSLVGRVNKNVKVCDAYARFQKISLIDRVRAKLMYTMEQKGAYYFTALDFVRNKAYDWAFFIGEWCSPSFVAYEVQAKIKAAWIHNDLSEAEYFNEEQYFYFLDQLDYFIFVSKNSMEASIEEYPFLRDKAVCIYNINDAGYIKERAEEAVADWPGTDLPVILTCANFRVQKNHLRQVRVMAELKRRGVDFLWLNIGATTDKVLVGKIRELCRKEGLEKEFLILGPKENPYQYMKKADAVAVLSDYESWSMVITEAKIIGTPVIATRTSGALEQLEDEKTGMLADFSVTDIAEQIEKLLKDSKLQSRIRENISSFDNTQEILNGFSELLCNGEGYEERKKKGSSSEDILYIIDDINYMGGAHIATKLQMKEFVRQGRSVTVFAGNVPEMGIRKELEGVGFLSWKDFPEDILFHERLFNCLTKRNRSGKECKKKLKQVWNVRVARKRDYYETDILPLIKDVFSQYSIACVMSEGSSFRAAVAKSACRKKIQWIHIDYCEWKERREWNRKITKDDGELYKDFDVIVVLSENIKASFCSIYPHLAEKVIVNKNFIPVNEIKRKSEGVLLKNKRKLKFVTVARLDYQKAYPRLIRVIKILREKGYNFYWIIIGGGEEYEKISNLIVKNNLSSYVELKGELINPFPVIKKADIFALLSDFEGIPNTIYEALILGLPVLATDVGGISTQIIDGVNGWLVDNQEKKIIKKLEWIFEHMDEMERIRENNQSYQYDNQKVLETNNRIFFV